MYDKILNPVADLGEAPPVMGEIFLGPHLVNRSGSATGIAGLKHIKTLVIMRNIENSCLQLKFSKFILCSQIPVGFYDSIIHGYKLFIIYYVVTGKEMLIPFKGQPVNADVFPARVSPG